MLCKVDIFTPDADYYVEQTNQHSDSSTCETKVKLANDLLTFYKNETTIYSLCTTEVQPNLDNLACFTKLLEIIIK